MKLMLAWDCWDGSGKLLDFLVTLEAGEKHPPTWELVEWKHLLIHSKDEVKPVIPQNDRILEDGVGASA